jgi:hypothetical protein
MGAKTLKYFIIGTFVSLYLAVSVISTIHVIEFFDLSNPKWLSVSLAIAFELGAAASLASLIALDKMNKLLVWSLFITLTMMQAMGNTYYAYINIEDFSMWSELFGLIEEDVIFQKRILAIISGAILPLVALGFIKSLVDYIKPESNPEEFIRNENIDESSYDENQDLYYSIQEEMRNDKTGEPKEIESDERDLAQPANISIENANSNRARGVEINPANLR